jgi:hypothetical protein
MNAQRRRQMRAAPELAIAEVAVAAVLALERVLQLEHPTVDDPDPGDPPTLVLARALLQSAQSLRDATRRYRVAVNRVLRDPPPPDYPF